MPYGFVVYNESGEVVVDDTSFAFWAGPVTTISADGNGVFHPVDDLSPDLEDLIFFEFPVGRHIYFSRGTFNEDWLELVARENDSSLGSIDCFVAKPFYKSSPGSYGIEVRDGNGDLTFHSGEGLLVIKDVIDFKGQENDTRSISSLSTFVTMSSHLAGLTGMGSFSLALGSGIKRTSSGQIEALLASVGAVPGVNISPNYGFICNLMTARVT